jgi:hypothetical protein
MPMTFDQLLTSQTPDVAKANLVAAIQARGVDPTTWRKGGVYDTVLSATAYLFSGLSVLVVAAVGSAFLDKASGDWLTLLALKVFNVVRPTATFATGSMTYHNAGGGVYSFQPGTVLTTNPSTGLTYYNVQSLFLNPGQTVTKGVQCTTLGTIGNAQANTVTVLQTSMPGVTVTNPTPILGRDDMIDDDLRALCSSKMSTLSNGGPRKAYEFAVLTALRFGGSPVDINRLTVTPYSSIGVVAIYVAAPSGPPISGDVTACQQNVDLLARPDAVIATVYPAVANNVTATLTVWALAQAGLLASDVSTAVTTAVQASISVYPIAGRKKPPVSQGYLYADTIEAIAQASHPSIYAVDGFGPDVPLAVNEVAVLTLNVIVNMVPPS